MAILANGLGWILHHNKDFHLLLYVYTAFYELMQVRTSSLRGLLLVYLQA